MRKYRSLLSATALVALLSTSRWADACIAVYTDYEIDTDQAELDAWAWVEDYYDEGYCFQQATYYWSYWEHSYEASVNIESPTQNTAYDYDSQSNVPYGGGSASTNATLSFLDDPGEFEIGWLIRLLCSIAGYVIDLDDTEYVDVPTPVLIEISRHTNTSLTSSEVDTNIFPSATQVLWNDDGLGDVACPVLFLRNGAIAVFSDGSGVINDEADRDQVIAVPGLAKVVSEINYCNGPTAPGVTLGCSSPAGMIVVRTTPTLEGILWAHEYGHNQYLWLINHGTDPNFLSYGTLVSTATRVTSSECDAYRNPL